MIVITEEVTNITNFGNIISVSEIRILVFQVFTCILFNLHPVIYSAENEWISVIYVDSKTFSSNIRDITITTIQR